MSGSYCQSTDVSITQESTEYLKDVVQELFGIDVEIDTLQKKLTEHRKRKKVLHDFLIQFMEQNEISELETPVDDVRLHTINHTKYVKPKLLIELLTQFAIQKDIPILRHFLTSTPLHHTQTSYTVKHTKKREQTQ